MLLAIIILGLALRLWLFGTTSDFPGDGPNRAVQAFLWSQHPSWITSAVWPPGHLYLNGLAMMIYPEPAVTVRLLNIFSSIPTMISMYFVTKRLFGKTAGLVSAALLACMPLHAGLSASSLTEAPALALLLASLALSLHLKPPAPDCARWNAKILFVTATMLLLLEMIRVESWMYAAAFVIYAWWKLRQIRLITVFGASLAVFPLYWLSSCWMDVNQPLYSFATWADPRNEHSSWLTAAGLVINRTLGQLGLIIPTLAILGFVSKCMNPSESLVYVDSKTAHVTKAEWLFTSGLLALTTLLSLCVATMHGTNLHDRYLLNSIIFLLPFAALAICQIGWIARRIGSTIPVKRTIGTLVAVMFGACAILLPSIIKQPEIYVSSGKPTELVEAANWLNGTEYVDKPILMTSIDYRAYFIPLFTKAAASNTRIVLDFWTPLLDTRDWLRAHEPHLIIIGQSDGKDLSAITSICSFKLDPKPVFTNKVVSAYRIMPGTFALKEHPVLPACLAYPAPSWRTLFQPWKRKPL